MKKYRICSVGLVMGLLCGCSTKANTSSSSTPTTTTTTTVATVVSSFDLDEEDRVETWDTTNCINVTLNGSTASFNGEGISETNSVLTISSPGTYVFSGTYNGSITVNCETKETVRIVLNGAEINSTSNSAIDITKASKVIITSAKDTSNILSDSDNYTLNADEEPTACIFAKSDLVLNGSGTLQINANYKDGIKSKDTLYIVNTNVDVTSVDNGITGKDTLGIVDSTITINAQGDGLKATNDKDENLGNLIVDSGSIKLTVGDDGMQAVSSLVINDGTIDIQAGEGYSAAVHTDDMQMGGGFGKGNMGGPSSTATSDTEETKSKGLTATGVMEINGGTITINAQDDAINCEGNLTVTKGTMNIQAGDDAMHADNILQIDGGDITIVNSYEGLEATTIILNDGKINITASDDGINGSNASSSEAMNDDGSMLYIHGGTIIVDASGDGIDMNGSGEMDGGTVTVYGPTNSGNGALDYNGTFNVNGGVFYAGGASGMAQTPSQSSSAYTFNIGTSSGSITIKDSDGNVVGEYVSSKSYQVLSFTSDQLKQGSTYTVEENGSVLDTVTISDSITYVNTSASQGGMGGGMQGPGGMGNQGGQKNPGQGI